jgi:hypothetical protein
MFFEEREKFFQLLIKDIENLQREAASKGKKAAVRLNGTSDIPWESTPFFMSSSVGQDTRHIIFEGFPDVQFYDYTKNPWRNVSHIPNYHLTFSRSETNDDQLFQAVINGMNIAIVFDGPLPEDYRIYDNNEVGNSSILLNVIDGDETDLRFLDNWSCVVGLKAKGKAKQDSSGFVVKV